MEVLCVVLYLAANCMWALLSDKKGKEVQPLDSRRVESETGHTVVKVR